MSYTGAMVYENCRRNFGSKREFEICYLFNLAGVPPVPCIRGFKINARALRKPFRGINKHLFVEIIVKACQGGLVAPYEYILVMSKRNRSALLEYCVLMEKAQMQLIYPFNTFSVGQRFFFDRVVTSHGIGIGDLLYTGKLDAFSSTTFHDRCDGYRRTLTFFKLANDMWIAGYTTCSWSALGFVAGLGVTKNDRSAFLLNISTRKRFQTNASPYSIYCMSECGPVFGMGDLGVGETAEQGKMKTINTPRAFAAY